MTTPAHDPARERALGGVYAFCAYFLWGFMPLYFLVLAPTGPWEVVSWRVLLSFVFCLLLLTVTRSWPKIIAIVRQPRLLLWTAAAGALIYINWQVFLIATLTGHVLESSLGYFINPIVTVLLAVLVQQDPVGQESGYSLMWLVLAVFAVIGTAAGIRSASVRPSTAPSPGSR